MDLLIAIGQTYYYNRKTCISQWERPISSSHVSSSTSESIATEHESSRTGDLNHLTKCMGCGGWGLGVVQPWGYCNHCTRYSSQLCLVLISRMLISGFFLRPYRLEHVSYITKFCFVTGFIIFLFNNIHYLVYRASNREKMKLAQKNSQKKQIQKRGILISHHTNTLSCLMFTTEQARLVCTHVKVVCLWHYLVNCPCRSSRPPLGKSNRRDHKKRAFSEDDDLDPMDPSSYSDAPRGGWYVSWSLMKTCILP